MEEVVITKNGDSEQEDSDGFCAVMTTIHINIFIMMIWMNMSPMKEREFTGT